MILTAVEGVYQNLKGKLGDTLKFEIRYLAIGENIET